MSELNLRIAQNDDSEGLINLFSCAYGEEADCVLDVERDFPYLSAVRTYYGDGGGDILVAENHLGIVGMISWLPLKIDRAKPGFGISEGMIIDHLFVHPLVRRTRLGMELMFAAIDHADNVECPIIETWMNVKFHRGHKFLRFFTFDHLAETRITHDLQKSTQRRYILDVDDFLEELDHDTAFYNSFFSPDHQQSEENEHADIDDPSQYVIDNSEPWR